MVGSSVIEESMAEEKKKRERLAKQGETWIAVRVSDATKQRLEDDAARRGGSVSFLVRNLIAEHYDAIDGVRVPAFVPTHEDAAGNEVYEPIEDVRASPQKRAQAARLAGRKLDEIEGELRELRELRALLVEHDG